MTGSKGVVAILIVLVLAAAGYWFGVQRQAETQTDPATDSQTAQPGAEPSQSTQTQAGTEPEPAAPTTTAPEPDTPADTAAGTGAGAQPGIDTANWVCTAWDSLAGEKSDETCIQWSIRRGSQDE